jgi:hypothetical protein
MPLLGAARSVNRHSAIGLHTPLRPLRPHYTGLNTPGTDPAAALAPGTLPEALPGARASVLLQNLRIAPNYVVVSQGSGFRL